MRIILKILAAPFVVALTILVAVLSFLLSLSGLVLTLAAVVLGLAGLVGLFLEKDVAAGIGILVMAFAISPYGLPALGEWIVGKLDDLNYALRGFITG